MKILIIGPAWVGDMLMAQTLFKLLQQQHAHVVIDVLAPAWSKGLLQRMPEVRTAIDMPLTHGELNLKARYRLGKQLASEQYDQAIVLPNSFKSALIPFFAKIPKRTGWRGEMRYGLLNDVRVLDKQRYPLMVQRFAALAYAANARLPTSLPYPALQTSADKTTALMQRLSLSADRPILVLCPGAEYGVTKQWPAAYYAAIAAYKIQQQAQVWILGSAKDTTIVQEILSHLSSAEKKFCRDLTGNTTLDEVVDLLALAQQVVTNDSGLMHVAAAVGKPLIAIYGSTSPEFTPPLTEQAQIVSLRLDCSPCFARECPLGHTHCLKELKPDKVMPLLI